MLNLVVVRCGDQSLHPQWVHENSNFDTILSYYGEELPYDLMCIKNVHFYKGSKWEGLYDFFLNYQEIWKVYDYIWLPDDDLNTTTENINNFFELIHQYDFSLSQPALTHNSYFSHAMLLQIKGLIFRETNFVEVMAPCFSKDAFLKCWTTFNENKSGWGLDLLWPKILKKQKIGVIDATPIFHTRPVGIAGHGTGNRDNTPQVEYIALTEKYKLNLKLGCYKAMTINQKMLIRKHELLDVTVKGCIALRLANVDSFNRLYNEVINPNKVLKGIKL